MRKKVEKEKTERVDVEELQVYSDYLKYNPKVEFVSTGNHAIDRILGGGIALERVTEIYGPYSGGKTLLMLEIMAQISKLGGTNVLQDIEHAMDHGNEDRQGFALRIGVDPKRLYYSRPVTVEAAFHQQFNFAKDFRMRNKKDILGIGMDSLAAAPTEHEMKELDKADMTKAKSIGAWLRRMTGVVGKQRTVLIIVNQVRHKVGVMFGPTETTPGGDAPGFHASQRIRVEHRVLYQGHNKRFIENGKTVAIRVVVDCIKNKLSPPFRRCEVIVNFNDGILPWSGYADLLADEEKIERVDDGKAFQYQDKKFFWHEIDEMVDRYPELVL
jgi:recombination protein RecA